MWVLEKKNLKKNTKILQGFFQRFCFLCLFNLHIIIKMSLLLLLRRISQYKVVGETEGMKFGTGGGTYPTSRWCCSSHFIEEVQKSLTHNSLLLPVSTIPVLRWRTGGDGGGARPRTVKTTMNLVLVLVPRGEGLRPQQIKAEEKIPIGRKRQQRRRLSRAMSSRSV